MTEKEPKSRKEEEEEKYNETVFPQKKERFFSDDGKGLEEVKKIFEEWKEDLKKAVKDLDKNKDKDKE